MLLSLFKVTPLKSLLHLTSNKYNYTDKKQTNKQTDQKLALKQISWCGIEISIPSP